MTLIASNFIWPNGELLSRQSTSRSITATDQQAAMICQAPKDGDITDVYFATRTVTTGCTVTASVQTVDLSTGDPSGSLVNGGASGTVAIANSDDNVIKQVTLGTPATVTAGQYIALNIAYSSGSTPSLNYGIENLVVGKAFPYIDYYNGASWTKAAGVHAMRVKYDGDSVETPIDGVPPSTITTQNSVNTGSSPDEYGNKISLPFSGRCTGISVYQSTSTDCNYVLYDNSDTVLGTAVFDGTVRTGNGIISLPFDAGYVDLVAGTTYRYTALPMSGSNVTINSMTTMSFDSWALTNSQIQQTTRVNGAGAWTDTSTAVVSLSLTFSHIDAFTVVQSNVSYT